jgi:tetratricopeptide (TPR) repeat protein
VLLAEGDFDGATAALQRASKFTPAPPPWTAAWLSGEINREQGNFAEAAENFRSVLYDDTQERRDRKFDFSRDYRIHNLLGLTLIDLAAQSQTRQETELAANYLSQAESEFKRALQDDSENLTAHAALAAVYKRLGNTEAADKHEELHLRYKADDNASDVARPEGRRRYPAADHAAEQLVIYSLNRQGAYGLATNP